MNYSDADSLVTDVIRLLKDDYTRTFGDDRHASNYALGYLSSLLARSMTNSDDAVRIVTDAKSSLVRSAK